LNNKLTMIYLLDQKKAKNIVSDNIFSILSFSAEFS